MVEYINTYEELLCVMKELIWDSSQVSRDIQRTQTEEEAQQRGDQVEGRHYE